MLPRRHETGNRVAYRAATPDDLPWDPAELEAAARAVLPASAATYYETTAAYPPARDNEAAWQSWRFTPRVGVDVSTVSTTTRLLGRDHPAPLLLAPCAFAGYADPDGEWAVARAAARSGTTYVVSAASSKPQPSVPTSAGGPCWVQLYLPASTVASDGVVKTSEDAGFEAIVVTLDAPVGSLRRRGYVPDAQVSDPFTHGRSGGSPLNPAVTWRTIEHVTARSALPVLVKGILRADDACSALSSGAAGVVVSNHGARQLDGVIPTACVIEEIAEAVAGRGAVLVDGGIRSGRDILRALCLGAHAVLVGRPYLWALAVGGEGGVDLLVRRYQLEFENALTLTGCRAVSEAGRSLVRSWPEPA